VVWCAHTSGRTLDHRHLEHRKIGRSPAPRAGHPLAQHAADLRWFVTGKALIVGSLPCSATVSADARYFDRVPRAYVATRPSKST
jgi:hypothetical protein